MVEKWSCTAEPIAIADYALCIQILPVAKARDTCRRSSHRGLHYAEQNHRILLSC